MTPKFFSLHISGNECDREIKKASPFISPSPSSSFIHDHRLPLSFAIAVYRPFKEGLTIFILSLSLSFSPAAISAPTDACSVSHHLRSLHWAPNRSISCVCSLISLSINEYRLLRLESELLSDHWYSSYIGWLCVWLFFSISFNCWWYFCY